MSKFLKTLIKTVKKESNGFAEKFVVAARGGAEITAQQILEAASKQNQPSDVILGKVIDAVKAGLAQTGQQMMTAGVDLVKGVSSQEDSSTPSKSSKSSDSINNELMSAEIDLSNGAGPLDDTSK
jgi:hypothetical protein